MYQLIFISTILVLTLVYLKGRYNKSYWEKRGAAFYDRNRVLGIFWDFLVTDKAMFQIFNELYHKYRDQPAVGIGTLTRPTLYVIDPINMQHVTQLDSNSFSHRGVEVNKEDKLADNILFMNGPRWKLMRQKMSPLFTAAKLKNMFYIMDKSAQDFMEHLKEYPDKLKGNGYNTINEFCSAAIAAAVFGIGTESTFKSPFLEMARDAMKLNWKTNLKFGINNMSSTLGKLLGLKIFKDQEEFFIGAIKQVLRAREKENVKKHDFADICLSLQKAGTMRDPDTGEELEPTDEILAAQGFLFFIAGVEPAASTMFGALTELGKHPDILKKLQQEIDETFKKYDGKITYEVVSEMKYLDQVLNEALRMHAPTGFSGRQCVKDSVLPVGNIKVSKGTMVWTPIYDYHFDLEYFPEPDRFDPERFAPENKGKSELMYVPFGKGARICIGMRYAKMQILVGLLYLLRNYEVVSTIDKNSRKFVKGQMQVRRIDTDVEFIPRNV